MQLRARLRRLKPLLLFFGLYTGLFLLLYATFSYTLPFLAGLLLALLTQPLCRWLRKRLRLPASGAAVLATLLVYAVLFGLLALLGAAVFREGQKLVGWIGELSPESIDQLLAPLYAALERAGAFWQTVSPGFAEQAQQALSALAESVLAFLGDLVRQLLSWLTSLPMVVMLCVVSVLATYFFARDLEKLKAHAARIFAGSSQKLRALSKNGKTMGGRFLLSYLLIYGLTFLESLVVFAVLGVPYPFVFALLSGIADILPILGPGTVYVPMAVVYLCLGDWGKALLLLICWVAVSAVRQVVEPKIIAKSLSIHPLAMVAAVYFALVAGSFAALLYFVGLLFCYGVLVQDGLLPALSEALEAPAEPSA